jgi:hypothetical protein
MTRLPIPFLVHALSARLAYETARAYAELAADVVVAREVDLTEAQHWARERHHRVETPRRRHGLTRARRAALTRARRAVDAREVLAGAMDLVEEFAHKFAREMTAARDAHADYMRTRDARPVVRW